jgi:hypothetical protein
MSKKKGQHNYKPKKRQNTDYPIKFITVPQKYSIEEQLEIVKAYQTINPPSINKEQELLQTLAQFVIN